jgi:hypothetical protein
MCLVEAVQNRRRVCHECYAEALYMTPHGMMCAADAMTAAANQPDGEETWVPILMKRPHRDAEHRGTSIEIDLTKF